VLLPALLAVACGSTESGGDAGPAAETTRSSTVEETQATAAMTYEPRLGEVLREFIQAAADGDAGGLWQLLSTESQARLGPTEDAFAGRFVSDFRDGLGTFAGTAAEIVVSGADPNGWGVAAIAGERVRQGKQEFAAYATALRLEAGEWRLELGAPIALKHLTGGSSDTLDVEVSAKSTIEAAGLWVDGQPLRASIQGTARDHFVVHAERLQLGSERHVAVIFARTSDAAAAGAFELSAPGAATT
jgi:hypothetical protein